MKYTLLELVQGILAAMDSDEVTSITDTTESYQVALLLKDVFYDMASELNLPEHKGLFELNASGDNAKPTLMTVPDNVVLLEWIKYDNKETSDTYSNYQEVMFMPFNEFLVMQQGLSSLATTESGEMTFTSNGESFNVLYAKDRFPLYYTSMDDRTIIFDAYKDTEDTTLQKSKTMCSGSVYNAFTLEDSFTADLDASQFAYYRNRAKVRAFAELKQAENAEAAYEAKRQKLVVQKRKRTVPDLPELYKGPRYGRQGDGIYGFGNRIPKFLRNGD